MIVASANAVRRRFDVAYTALRAGMPPDSNELNRLEGSADFLDDPAAMYLMYSVSDFALSSVARSPVYRHHLQTRMTRGEQNGVETIHAFGDALSAASFAARLRVGCFVRDEALRGLPDSMRWQQIHYMTTANESDGPLSFRAVEDSRGRLTPTGQFTTLDSPSFTGVYCEHLPEGDSLHWGAETTRRYGGYLLDVAGEALSEEESNRHWEIRFC